MSIEGLFGELPAAAEQAAILGLWRTAQYHKANRGFDADGAIRLISSGWAGWVRHTRDGRRMIFLFLMPGDFIVPGLFSVPDCDLVSLTPIRTVDASPLIHDDGKTCPQSHEMINSSRLRYHHLLLDHMTRLMIGSTTSSISLLLTEFYDRSLRSGACVNGRFGLPIGQRMLAAALGRSAVQVNKVISKLQADGLIRVGYDWLEVIEAQALRSLSGLSKTNEASPAQPDTLIARDMSAIAQDKPVPQLLEEMRVRAG